MTCGACDPEAFRKDEQSRIVGYLVVREMHQATALARKLYFLGAELVLSDPPTGKVRQRKGFVKLTSVLRKGDKLVLASESDLGTKPQARDTVLSEIAAEGVEIAIMRPEYFEGDTQS